MGKSTKKRKRQNLKADNAPPPAAAPLTAPGEARPCTQHTLPRSSPLKVEQGRTLQLGRLDFPPALQRRFFTSVRS
jgi:hypothetical protein